MYVALTDFKDKVQKKRYEKGDKYEGSPERVGFLLGLGFIEKVESSPAKKATAKK